VILVDTSVLLDVLRDDQQWRDWSTAALVAATARGTVKLNQVVYAELSSQYDRIESLDAALAGLDFETLQIPKPALFLAGRAFRLYRRQGGMKTSVLSDFFIGAHAAVADAELLTRDPKHVRSYFPTVAIISP
jgi:hypothetical protein